MNPTTPVPECTGIIEQDQNTLVYQPSNLEIPTEEFWDIWHGLQKEVGQDVWQQEYTSQDKDYNAVQERFLMVSGRMTWADPFQDEDGFVDAVK